VAPRLADELWGHVSAVLTSATIPDTLAKDLGLGATVAIEHVDSPFDYQENSLLYVPEAFRRATTPGRRGDHRGVDRAHRGRRGKNARPVHESRGDEPRRRSGRDARRYPDPRARHFVTPAHHRTVSRQRGGEFCSPSPASGRASTFRAIRSVCHDRPTTFAVPNDPLAEARRSRSLRPFYEVDLRDGDAARPGRRPTHSHQERPGRRRGTGHAPRRVELPFIAVSKAPADEEDPRQGAGARVLERTPRRSVTEAVQDVVALLPTRFHTNLELEEAAFGQLAPSGDSHVL